MTVRFARVLSTLLVLGVATTAHAAAGNGIRLGGSDARLHPFFDLELRYDDNVAYTARDQAVSDLILHLRPGVELKAPGDLAAVEFHGALDWAQYLGIDNRTTTDAAGNRTKLDTTNFSRLFATATLGASFNRSGAVSPRVDNSFTRQVSGTSLAAASTAVISNQNVLSMAVPWRPGGGALVVAANGQWILETYEKYKEQDPGLDTSKLGYSQFRGGGEVQWRFLPRTTALLQGGYFTRSPNASNRLDDANGFDVMAGVTGLLTQRISATAKAGYASTTASSVTAANLASKTSGSVAADVSAEWLPIDSLSLRVGYVRSLGLDPTASTYISDAVSGGVKLKLADTVAARVGATWSNLDFQRTDAIRLLTGTNSGSASTTFLRIDPTVEGTFGGWFTAAVGYVYSSRTAKFPGTTVPDYTKNEAFVRAGVTY
jgi:hypothetical protein